MTRKYMRIAIVLGVALACSSCEKKIDLNSALQSYRQAQSCCSSMSQLPMGAILPEGETIFSITAADSAFDFRDEGLSYFKAFQLPALNQPFHVVVESDMFLSEQGFPGTIFYPVVTLLDENKQVVSETPQDRFEFVRAAMFGRAAHLQNTIEVPSPDRVHYVVVHTTRYVLAQGYPIQLGPSGQMIGAGGLFVMVPTPATVMNYHPSPTTVADSLRLLVEKDNGAQATP